MPADRDMRPACHASVQNRIGKSLIAAEADTNPNHAIDRRQQVAQRSFAATVALSVVEASRCQMRSNALRFQPCYCVDPCTAWAMGSIGRG